MPETDSTTRQAPSPIPAPRAVTADYGICWERSTQRAGQMYEMRAGWAVYAIATAREVGGGWTRYDTEDQAETAAREAQAARDAEAPRVAVAAAEKIVAEAAAQIPAAAASTPRATERQVSHILDLLQRRKANGDGGGFYAGPTDADGVRAMSRADASTYIASLREEY